MLPTSREKSRGAALKTIVDRPVQRKLPDHSGDFQTLEEMEWAFSKGDISVFQRVLESRSSIVLRIHAVCMLADMKNEGAVSFLCRPLREDSSPLVRHEAAFALGQLGFKSAVPALLEAMKNDDSVLVRHESAVALGSIGDERSRAALTEALNDPDEDVRLSAECALADIDFLKRLRLRTATRALS